MFSRHAPPPTTACRQGFADNTADGFDGVVVSFNTNAGPEEPIWRITITSANTVANSCPGTSGCQHRPNAVAVDPDPGTNDDDDGVWVVGTTDGVLANGDPNGSEHDPEACSDPGRLDGFLLKLRRDNGSLVETRQLGTCGADTPSAVAVDRMSTSTVSTNRECRIVVVGSTNADLPSHAASAIADPELQSSRDAFVQWYRCDRAWHRLSVQFGNGDSDDTARGVAVDRRDGAVIVVGKTNGVIEPAAASSGSRTANNGEDDAFVVKFDADGDVVWSHQLGGDGSDGANAIAIDQLDGSVVVTGYITTAVASGGSRTTPPPSTAATALKQAFVVRFDQNGLRLAEIMFGAFPRSTSSAPAGNSEGWSVAIEAPPASTGRDAAIIVAGTFAADPEGEPATASTSFPANAFVVRMDGFPTSAPSLPPTQRPTQRPTKSPTTLEPTNAPATSEPTDAPATSEPTAPPTPASLEPTNAPATLEPTAPPTPATLEPTTAPSPALTNAEGKLEPTPPPTASSIGKNGDDSSDETDAGAGGSAAIIAVVAIAVVLLIIVLAIWRKQQRQNKSTPPFDHHDGHQTVDNTTNPLYRGQSSTSARKLVLGATPGAQSDTDVAATYGTYGVPVDASRTDLPAAGPYQIPVDGEVYYSEPTEPRAGKGIEAVVISPTYSAPAVYAVPADLPRNPAGADAQGYEIPIEITKMVPSVDQDGYEVPDSHAAKVDTDGYEIPVLDQPVYAAPDAEYTEVIY